MTISADYLPNIDIGNGVTVTFPVNFPFGAKGDLVVSLFDTTTSADVTPAPVLNGAAVYDYSVSGTPDPDTGIYPNGSITFNTAPPSTYRVVRERATPRRQNTSLTNNGPFPAKTVEGAFDRDEMQLQEQGSRLDYAIVSPVSDGPQDMVLPAKALRLGKVLSFDAVTGLPTVSDPMVVAAQTAAAQAIAAAAVAGSDLWSRPVLSILATPPVSPTMGDRYLVAHSATTGAFIGHEDQVAQYNVSSWIFSGAPLNHQELNVAGVAYAFQTPLWGQVPIAARVTWDKPVIDFITAAALAGLSPTIGDRYLLTDGTHINAVAERFADGWDYTAVAKEAQRILVTSEELEHRFDGSTFQSRSFYNTLLWNRPIGGIRGKARNGLHINIGDSETAGAGGDNTVSGLWKNGFPAVSAQIITRTTDILATAQSSFGDLNTVDAGATFSHYDPRLSMPAGWAFNAAARSINSRCLTNSTTTNPMIFTPEFDTRLVATDTAYVLYIGGTVAQGYGIMNLQLKAGATVNGSSAVNTGSHGSRGVYCAKISGTPGANTLTMALDAASLAAGKSINPIGWIVMDSASGQQMVVLNFGWFGGFCSDFLDTTQDWAPLKALTALLAQMALDGFEFPQFEIGFGANEMINGVSVATYIANMGTLIDTLSVAPYAGSICLRFPPQLDASRVALATQKLYERALLKLAKTKGVPIRNLTGEFVSYTTANTLGFMYDTVHPNGFGYQIDGAKSAHNAVWGLLPK